MNGSASSNAMQGELIYPEPDPMQAEVARLVGILAGKGWMKRKELVAIEPRWDDEDGRTLRAIAEAADGKVMSWSGSPGYKLMREATQEDRDHMNRTFLRSMKSLDAKRCALLAGFHGPTYVPRTAILPAEEPEKARAGMPVEELHEKLMRDPEYRSAYKAIPPEVAL